MERLTPQEAFNRLKTVFPWLRYLRRHAQCVCLSDQSVTRATVTANIDWGTETEYPSRWRPVNIGDAIDALNGKIIQCRSGNFRGVLFGASRPTNNTIAYGISNNDESVWRSDVEVYE